MSFRGRRVAQWEPNRYTPLFFLDEAVALAAGHRPCAECRRGAYSSYRTLWSQTNGGTAVYARDMDTKLHFERTTKSPHRAPWDSLPDGVFVANDCGPAVVVGNHLAIWDRNDNIYRERLPRLGTGAATILTPPSTVEVIRAGYSPQIHGSAHSARRKA